MQARNLPLSSVFRLAISVTLREARLLTESKLQSRISAVSSTNFEEHIVSPLLGLIEITCGSSQDAEAHLFTDHDGMKMWHS